MKRLLLLAIVATIAFTGCKKDDDDAPSYTADVTINGTKTSFDAMIYLDYSSGSSTVYSLSAGEESGDYMSISIVDPKVGDFSFSLTNTVTFNIGTDTYTSKSDAGAITVKAKDDKSISGTFSGSFTKNAGSTAIEITGTFSAESLANYME